jgi:hypothetical protein
MKYQAKNTICAGGEIVAIVVYAGDSGAYWGPYKSLEAASAEASFQNDFIDAVAENARVDAELRRATRT